MGDNVKVHNKIDTGLNADSVEFCPYEDQLNVLLCGTYKLQEESKQRIGGVTVYEVSCNDGKPCISPVNQIDMCGVLDIKWPSSRLHEKSLFGLVDAEGFFQVFHLEKNSPPVSIAKLELSESSLGLSLGWDRGKDGGCSKAVCSDSAGCISVFDIGNNSSSLSSRWKAHNFEAWITAFHDFDSNVVYSGGDDCLLKGWDLRDTTKPTFVSKRHTMGVCSIQSHPFDEHIYATGSYDEELLIWDRRQQRRALASINLGGGIWRIKWDPFFGSYILTATMYNGTHIVKTDQLGTDSLSIVAQHGDHNLAYGADWCRLDKYLKKIQTKPTLDDSILENPNFLISTCSFYDNSLHLWEWTLCASNNKVAN